MNNIYLFTFLTLIIFSCIGHQNEVLTVRGFQEKVLENGADAIVIDLRTTEEMQDGYIPGAVQVDFHNPNFNEQLNTLDKGKTYLIYCKSGNRSGRTLSLMQEKGFLEVYDLEGGFKAWENAGMTVEK